MEAQAGFVSVCLAAGHGAEEEQENDTFPVAEALCDVKEAMAQHVAGLSQGADDDEGANPSGLHAARVRHVRAHGMQPPAAAAEAS